MCMVVLESRPCADFPGRRGFLAAEADVAQGAAGTGLGTLSRAQFLVKDNAADRELALPGSNGFAAGAEGVGRSADPFRSREGVVEQRSPPAPRRRFGAWIRQGFRGSGSRRRRRRPPCSGCARGPARRARREDAMAHRREDKTEEDAAEQCERDGKREDGSVDADDGFGWKRIWESNSGSRASQYDAATPRIAPVQEMTKASTSNWRTMRQRLCRLPCGWRAHAGVCVRGPTEGWSSWRSR